MKVVEGNLIELALAGELDVIVHGCNCFHTMGAGIAKAIKSEFPEAFEADKAAPRGDKSKLGTTSSCQIVRNSHQITVVNAYTQFQWRGRGRKADYHAIESCFALVAKSFPKSRIGYPLIGAGLAGGDWEVISGLIEKTLQGLDHSLVIFKP